MQALTKPLCVPHAAISKFVIAKQALTGLQILTSL